MNTYIELVKTYPIYSAMIQFAVLGTLGDIFSKWMQRGTVFMPYKFRVIFLKMLEWALLAIAIKYAFVGFQGFIDGLIVQGFLPELNLFGRAFSVSVAMNVQFGLLLVIIHLISKTLWLITIICYLIMKIIKCIGFRNVLSSLI